MASDMVVALAPATADGHALLGHNCNAGWGVAALPLRQPGRDFPPGQLVQAAHLVIPQSRHTFAFVGTQLTGDWGCPHGVNERGVALGWTATHSRLKCDDPGLTGADLVRLGLERASSACQAVEVITDLIARHGHEGASALLVTDATEAFILEAAGHHWALGHVASVRAAVPACLLRQDWDRISRGLSDLAIGRGWWPADGCKLDFAGAVGRIGPDHARAMRRWGQAMMFLEEHSGELSLELLRRALQEQAEAVADRGPADALTACSFVARLGADELPAAWWAVGEPGTSIYLPIFPFADLPPALAGVGDWLGQWRGARPRATLRAALGVLQHRLDILVLELLPEASALYHRGDAEGVRRLCASFMQHCVERLEDLDEQLRPPVAGEAERLRGPHSPAMIPGAIF